MYQRNSEGTPNDEGSSSDQPARSIMPNLVNNRRLTIYYVYNTSTFGANRLLQRVVQALRFKFFLQFTSLISYWYPISNMQRILCASLNKQRSHLYRHVSNLSKGLHCRVYNRTKFADKNNRSRIV